MSHLLTLAFAFTLIAATASAQTTGRYGRFPIYDIGNPSLTTPTTH